MPTPAPRARSFLLLLRPLQWTKNLLVFAALLFARRYAEPGEALRAGAMFVAFCLASSALYALNDVLDRDADRRHPRKRYRPVASGALSPAAALAVSVVLILLAFAAAWTLSTPAHMSLIAYLALGAAYSLYLKRVVIVDVLVLAAGFVLRAAAGGFAIDVEISPWLLMCTMLLALFLAVAKRRHELTEAKAPTIQRPVLGDYAPLLLDQMLAVTAACTLMAYVLYTFSEQTAQKFPSHLMPMTSVFVMFGLFRYLLLVYRRDEGGEPEVLLVRDPAIRWTVILYVLAVLLAVR
jgi:4-hydroxybenzoate polyprenyltransferase